MITAITLPYTYDSLEPFYDRQTLHIHYEILYKGYIDNFNKISDGLKKARQTGNFDNIKCLEKDLSYNGSGIILHELFFTNMKPVTTLGQISEVLQEQIVIDFGNFEDFKAQFVSASLNVEASRMVFTCLVSKNEQIRNIAM